ncbi:MAG: NDP-sugar synthase [Aeropyrum sp.]|nr:NDP-sugar synthase [Aeropyrum sp.]
MGLGAIVLAGGVGRRLTPITKARPKPYLKIAGRRLYEYSISHVSVVRPSIEKAVLVTPPGAGSPPDGVPSWIEVAEQEGEGISNGLRTGLEVLGGDVGEVLVSFTGFIASPETMALQALEAYAASGFKSIMLVAPVSTGAETYGFVDLEPGGKVKGYKKGVRLAWAGGRGYVFAGILVGDRSSIEVLAASGFEEGLNKLAESEALGASVWTGKWAEIAFPWDLLRAPSILLSGMPAQIHSKAHIARTASISGPVIVEEGAEVGENSVIRGPAYIGKNASIGSGAIISGSIVEDKAKIGANSVVENSVVMESARVGSLSVVRSSIVGEAGVVGDVCVLQDGPPIGLPPGPAREAAEEIGVENIVLGSIVAPRAKVGSLSSLDAGQVVE